MCALWLTDEKNPARAYAHQSRTGVTTNTQSRMEFVGQRGETKRGARLFATIFVLTKHASPTSRALIGKLISGWRSPTGGAPSTSSRTATGGVIQPRAMIRSLERGVFSAPC